MGVLKKPAGTQAGIEARISTVLSEIQPLLRIDHCRLELVAFTMATGALKVRVSGECPDCEISPATFSTAIAARVKLQVPEVREVTFSD
jgi:Fe-S cluster biogenesis protein NfuA